MATFDLAQFVEAPSRGLIGACRKRDLLDVADHFGFQVDSSMLKVELQEVVISGLEDLGLLTRQQAASPAEARVHAEPPLATPPPVSPAAPDDRDRLVTAAGDADPADSDEDMTPAEFRLRIEQLRLDAEDRAQRRQLEFEMRKLELEADTKLRLRKLELEHEAVKAEKETSPVSSPPQDSFNISNCMALMPVFRESEVDCYFSAFERIATALNWPRDVWPLLLQCRFTGKASEVVAALSVSDSNNYDTVKTAVLQAYELVPEAYRQKLRLSRKNSAQTHIEFARVKTVLFDKWCNSSKVKDFSTLRELLLLEEFKRCIPDKVVQYVNEQKVTSLSAAAQLADEFVLTHRVNFDPNRRPSPGPPAEADITNVVPEPALCFYCHKPGHVIKDCPILQAKNVRQEQPDNVEVFTCSAHVTVGERDVGSCFKPFVFSGFVSLSADDRPVPIKILRDTGASHSLILSSALPFSGRSACGFKVVVKGIAPLSFQRPVHRVFLTSDLVTGYFNIAVCRSLPVDGVVLLLGNDIAGDLVVPPAWSKPQAKGVENMSVSTPNGLIAGNKNTGSCEMDRRVAEPEPPVFDAGFCGPAKIKRKNKKKPL
uniref:CCHC-type domain-containing protein n=2 Tax=Nothobranchius furzeri TaxID=105023 RepID=A0A1A8BAH2_NOTFU